MKEAAINTALRRSLEVAGAYAYKIADTPARGFGMQFSPAKPCDLIACFEGRFVGIETKLLAGYKAFGWRNLRDSQRESLAAIDGAGGLALVAAVVYVPRRLKRLFLWPWSEVFDGWRLTAEELRSTAGLDAVRGSWSLRGWLEEIARG